MDAAKKTTARRLGRGLSSLMALDTPVRVDAAGPEAIIEAKPAIRPTQRTENGVLSDDAGLSDFQSIAVGEIGPSRFQPRKMMDEGTIARLAESIKRSGLMQPVIVRPVGGGRYELVAGERRWRAAQAAGLKAIPALVREMGDEQAAEWGLVENVQREDLNPMDRGWALRALSEKFGLVQAQLADRVGLERSTVANLVRLTELEPEIAELISKGSLGMGHGRALLGMPLGQQRIIMARNAAMYGYSVRKLEQEVKYAPGAARAAAGIAAGVATDEMSARLAGLRDLERQIGQQLGTKVSISTDRGGKKGRVAIEFYGLDHFDGLLRKMGIRAG